MRRLPLALAPTLTALVIATAAHAVATTANSFQGKVEILKGTTLQATYFSPMTACTSSSQASPCLTFVNVSNRDNVRVLKACGGNSAVTIGTSGSHSTTCSGSGYTIRWTMQLYNCDTASPPVCDTATNPTAVWGTIAVN